jgi:preprotein translocase subunit SecF
MSRLGTLGGRLYRGEISIDFVGRKKLWYMISGAILIISLAALLVRGLHFSVDFQGGSIYKFSTPAGVTLTQPQVTNTAISAGAPTSLIVEKVGSHGWDVQTPSLKGKVQYQILGALAKQAHLRSGGVSLSSIGPSWGSQISGKAVEALIAFLVVIVLYLSVAFEWRMAVSALIALAHDIVITVGVYALTGFEVSPATVIGLLTILGYSLYDTVVVFVRENTAGLLATRRTRYSEAANLALNQTLVRSINTSLIALLPVVAILAVSVFLLGNGELKDLSLVLFVGMLSGTYSSICIATPVLADLKERQPEFRQLTKQIAQRASSAKRQAKVAAGTAAKAKPGSGGKGGGGGRGAVAVEEDVPPAGLAAGDLGAEDVGADHTGAEDEVTAASGASGRVPATSQSRSAAAVRTTTGPRQQPRRTTSAQRKKRK